MLRALWLALTLAICLAPPARTQSGGKTLAAIVAANAEAIAKPSRQTIGPVADDMAVSGDALAAAFLRASATKRLGRRNATKRSFCSRPTPVALP